MARLGATVTGIDASEELIKIADEHKNIDPKIAKYKPTYIYTTVEVTKTYILVISEKSKTIFIKTSNYCKPSQHTTS